MVLLFTSEDSKKGIDVLHFATWNCHYSMYYIWILNCLGTLIYLKNRVCVFWDKHNHLLFWPQYLWKAPTITRETPQKCQVCACVSFLFLFIYVSMHTLLCWPGSWINIFPISAEKLRRLMFSVFQNEEFLFKRPFVHFSNLHGFAFRLLHSNHNFRERLNKCRV